jgi:hypothetical protein
MQAKSKESGWRRVIPVIVTVCWVVLGSAEFVAASGDEKTADQAHRFAKEEEVFAADAEKRLRAVSTPTAPFAEVRKAETYRDATAEGLRADQATERVSLDGALQHRVVGVLFLIAAAGYAALALWKRRA